MVDLKTGPRLEKYVTANGFLLPWFWFHACVMFRVAAGHHHQPVSQGSQSFLSRDVINDERCRGRTPDSCLQTSNRPLTIRPIMAHWKY